MLVVRNIGQLVLPRFDAETGRPRVETIDRAAVLIDGGRIAEFGPAESVDVPADADELDAGGGCVTPGLIDCHTHTVFAGTREHEFVRRIEGQSYAEIAEEGGGIRVTVEAVRRASVDELVGLALPRLQRMLGNGVTTVEIKSGYGLTVDDEIKMLRAVARLRSLQPIELIGTCLAAHTVPPEFADRRGAYLDMICDDAFLRRMANERLAEFCDVFCERTAFSVDESRRVLLAARRHGLTPKIHADQITQMGASRLAAEVGAVTADHLETIDADGIAAMRRAGTIAVLLPGCSFFLGVHQAPARAILDAGVPVAVATDYNPGSSMVESLPLVMSIACTQMRMTPNEVMVAVTVNAAAAVHRRETAGAIDADRAADLVILDVPDYARWMYEPGRNCVRTVIKGGRVVHRRQD
ncbi:MAG: imidazolonepropionase [Phycisphaerales bacterium]|nr:imidazolonepropionase [Phycisphaerales bacterium]